MTLRHYVIVTNNRQNLKKISYQNKVLVRQNIWWNGQNCLYKHTTSGGLSP